MKGNSIHWGFAGTLFCAHHPMGDAGMDGGPMKAVANQQLLIGGPPAPAPTSAATSDFLEGSGLFFWAWGMLGGKAGEQVKMRGKCQGRSRDSGRRLGNCTRIQPVAWELYARAGVDLI